MRVDDFARVRESWSGLSGVIRARYIGASHFGQSVCGIANNKAMLTMTRVGPFLNSFRQNISQEESSNQGDWKG